ncbi:TPA: hypothetical protein PFE14_002068 [Kluyvera ascorbata]|nr:hypothetical protein [Kluyvera ascorbata]
MRRLKVKELVAKAHASVADLPPAQGQIMRDVATRLDATFAALTESRREFRAADATIHNLELKVAAVVAENIHARERHIFIRALAVSILEHSGGRMDWRGAMEDATELLQTVDSVYAKTPATDAYLAEVRAQGVEGFLTFCGEENSVFVETKAYYRSLADAVDEFAAQLRQGAKS